MILAKKITNWISFSKKHPTGWNFRHGNGLLQAIKLWQFFKYIFIVALIFSIVLNFRCWCSLLLHFTIFNIYQFYNLNFLQSHSSAWILTHMGIKKIDTLASKCFKPRVAIIIVISSHDCWDSVYSKLVGVNFLIISPQ